MSLHSLSTICITARITSDAYFASEEAQMPHTGHANWFSGSIKHTLNAIPQFPVARRVYPFLLVKKSYIQLVC
jgi:hypothetical protein